MMAIIVLKQIHVYNKLLNILTFFGILFDTLIHSSLTSIEHMIAKYKNKVC